MSVLPVLFSLDPPSSPPVPSSSHLDDSVSQGALRLRAPYLPTLPEPQPSLPLHTDLPGHRCLHLERDWKEGPRGVISSLAPFLIFLRAPAPGIRNSTFHSRSQDSELLAQCGSHRVQESLGTSLSCDLGGLAAEPRRLLALLTQRGAAVPGLCSRLGLILRDHPGPCPHGGVTGGLEGLGLVRVSVSMPALCCFFQTLITFVNKHLNKLNLEVTELETQVGHSPQWRVGGGEAQPPFRVPHPCIARRAFHPDPELFLEGGDSVPLRGLNCLEFIGIYFEKLQE